MSQKIPTYSLMKTISGSMNIKQKFIGYYLEANFYKTTVKQYISRHTWTNSRCSITGIILQNNPRLSLTEYEQ